MRPSVDLKSSYLENLELRGISTREDLYQRVLTEVAHYLAGREPANWTRADFERFLKERADSLSPDEVAAYGIGLGVLTEIIEKSVARDMRVELDVSLATSSQLPNIAHDETLMPAAAQGVGNTSEIDVEGLEGSDDFLAENLEDWRRKTGRTDSNEIPGTGPYKAATRRRTNPNLRAIGARKGMTPDIRVQWVADGNYVHVAWSGFIEGATLRTAFASGVKLQNLHGSTGWLVDMAGASVLSERDSEWFAEWLLDVQKLGVRRFAVIQPENAISRMQLRRLRDANQASTAGIPDVERVEMAFFTAEDEAENWLYRG